LINVARAILPGGFTTRLSWDSYQHLDAAVYAVEHEWKTAQYLFRAKPGLGHIIPHGMEPEALRQLAEPQAEEDYLISAATIHPRKNSVLLAKTAHRAGTPIVFLGKPYAEDDPYFIEFKKWVDGRIVRYPGFVSTQEKYRYLRGARGFALLSQFESGCISVYEASAAGLPLFLSDLPWASKVYGEVRGAQFERVAAPEAMAPALKAFYDQAHRKSTPTFPLLTWRQVGEKYLAVYQSVLSRS
jgi:glycosyltransferase involved in cell wall biosynthesis